MVTVIAPHGAHVFRIRLLQGDALEHMCRAGPRAAARPDRRFACGPLCLVHGKRCLPTHL